MNGCSNARKKFGKMKASYMERIKLSKEVVYGDLWEDSFREVGCDKNGNKKHIVVGFTVPGVRMCFLPLKLDLEGGGSNNRHCSCKSSSSFLFAVQRMWFYFSFFFLFIFGR